MSDLQRVFQVIVPPLLTFYAIFLVMLVRAVRRPPEPASFSPPRPWRRFGRALVGTAVPGYAMFLLIVFVFHYLTSADREAMRSAVTEGGLLLVAVLPVLVVLSLVEEWIRERRSGA